MAGTPSPKFYDWSSRILLGLLRVPALSHAATLFARVWLRQSRLVQHLRTGPYDAVIDGGANIGEFAALVRMACPRLPLLCVEPHPPSAATLRRRGFSVVEAALWNQSGQLLLQQPAAATTSCSVVGEHTANRPTWHVKAVRLDELPISGKRLLIKLDLQGAEPQALEGMGDLWSRCAGLLLEVSYGPSGTYEPLRVLLVEQGFIECATFNELDGPVSPTEADKLWLRRSLLEGKSGTGMG